jgi:RNA polymerase sigma-70 factor (ECF subfamily)
LFHAGVARSEPGPLSVIDPADPPENQNAGSAPTEVVQRARDGDERAMTVLIELYQKRVAGYVFRMLCDANSVDDVCQVVFLRMCRSLAGLRDSARFEPWLFRIARNACRSHRRKARLRRLFTPLLPIHDAAVLTEPAPPAGGLAAVNDALKRLSLRDRELLALCTQDYSYQQMAAITGLSLANLKIRMFRARQALKRALPNE